MSESSSSEGEDTWIQWFCGLQGHEMFCEVDRGYIEDGFNLYGLRHWVPNINDSLDVILDRVGHSEASAELMEATYALYGLIHARYVLTSSGLEAMYAKYTLQEFGNCPHFLCRGQAVVPLGVRDEPHLETVKLFCPKCQDIYVHPSHAAQRVDGAYFGTTFPHLFFMTYGNMIPDPPEQRFVPRVFGFRVHRSAVNGAYARGQGSQHRDDHDRHLEERRRQIRGAGDGSLGAGAGAVVPEGGAVLVTRGGQTSGARGVSARRRAENRGEGHDGVEMDEGEGAPRGKGPPDGTFKRSADGQWAQRDDTGEKNKDKSNNMDGGKGAGSASRVRGSVENGRTSSSIRDSRSVTTSRSKGRTPASGLLEEDKMGKEKGAKEKRTRDEHEGEDVGRDRAGKVSPDMDTREGILPRYFTGRPGSDRRGDKSRDTGIMPMEHEEEEERGRNMTSRMPEDNGNAGRSQQRGQDGDGARAHSSNGSRGPVYEGGNGAAKSGPLVIGGRSGGGYQERGRKRSPDSDVEAPELADDAAGGVGGGGGDGAGRGGGGGTGAGGGGGSKGRGKVPRNSRNATSVRAGSTGNTASAATGSSLTEGGASTRRTRGGLG